MKPSQLPLRALFASLLLLPFAASGAPTITTAPASQTALAGTNPYFSVVATGTGTLSYQWNKGGAAISSGTLSTLSFTSVQLTNAGAYTVAVRDTNGITT